MQTFLPYRSFIKSARCLDRQRLGKQRVEGYQILRTLMGISFGWSNHPATRMWRNYEPALYLYTQTCIDAWVERGYKNTIVLPVPSFKLGYPMPPWLGDDRLHSSHRSNPVSYTHLTLPTILHSSHRANLLRKLPAHYSTYGWTDDPAAPYYWPVAS